MTIAACSRKPQASINRIAVLPFENLSGDPSLDWISTAAPSILAEQLVGTPATLPMRASTVNDGYLESATRFVHGNFTKRRGGLRFEIEVEDAARHKMVVQDDYQGPVLDAMNRAAHRLDSRAQPFSTSNAEAVAAWARGDEEHAVALDPDFGTAWVAWAEALAARGQIEQAIAATARALDRSTLHAPIDQARLAVLSATLRKDGPAREKALATLHSIEPADTTTTLRLAEAETQARDFSAATALYKTILATEPDNTAALLALGYDQAFLGDLDAARQTFETYGQREGQKTNSFDSLGEAYFSNGKFAQAEKYFLQAYGSNQAFLGGVDLAKAAYAHWLGGDLTGADAIMARYLDSRVKARDPLVAWREACWYDATGRRDQATQALKRAPQQLAQKQIEAWNAEAPTDLEALKQAYQQSAPSTDGVVRTRYAAALVEAGRTEEAKKLLDRWPLPAENSPEALLESRVFPTFVELRHQLLK